ncbi:MAG: site-specific DNA-methyltransferase [Phycisphaeraceae bacterium]|nr:site-specific DNA-methyltransferase [Phycisphaeraceae bacterium]
MKLNTVHCMGALEGLQQLPNNSVDVVVTSPPYWSLRDYGESTTMIWDGNPTCEHDFSCREPWGHLIKRRTGGTRRAKISRDQKGLGHFETHSHICGQCGAWRGQLGMEPNFAMFVKHLLDIFDEVKRVLKPHGTCWVNLGDTYGGCSTTAHYAARRKGKTSILKDDLSYLQAVGHCRGRWDKCLVGVPERFMLGMVERGWTLRNKIIWHKPNHIPNSARDRFTNSWEYLLLFVKSKRYYFDLDAVRQPHKRGTPQAERDYRRMMAGRQRFKGKFAELGLGGSMLGGHPKGKNPGDVMWVSPQQSRKVATDSVRGWASKSGHEHTHERKYALGTNEDYWSIATGSHHVFHPAMFPEALVERPIKTTPLLVCNSCGQPQTFLPTPRKLGKGATETAKWTGGCQCNSGYRKALVLDPFMGAGTTAVVARKLGRDFIGFEINPEFVSMAERRLARLDEHDGKEAVAA